MISIKRYFGEPRDTRWLNQLNRWFTTVGFGSIEERSQVVSGWDVTVCARADKSPGEPEVQVVTIYSFDYFGVKGISSVVLAVDEAVEPEIVRYLTRAGFFPCESPDGVSIARRLVHAGFGGRNGLGHDLVAPWAVARGTFLRERFPQGTHLVGGSAMMPGRVRLPPF